MVALLRGAPYAGGADSYGYVSQADLWAKGTLRLEQPLMRSAGWPFAAESLAPLGYLPTKDGTAIVPLYSPGLPMLMAVFERVVGRESVFYVVPLLGGLAVWATYLMGTRFAGRTVGAAAAMLLATSPPFLFQLMYPMSDVPVAAWWALALALLLPERRDAALAAGFAAGLAILTRPNLVLLATIPGVLLVWRSARERAFTGRAGQRALLFAAGVIPACLVVAIINTRLYGSPLSCGYSGSFNDNFSWQHLLPNLSRYPQWLMDTETRVVLLALVAPFVMAQSDGESSRRGEQRAVAIMWLCFILGVFSCYLFFRPFDNWFWLRYVLSALPPMFVLTSIALVGMLARLERGVRLMVMAVIIGALAWHGVAFERREGIFRFKEEDLRNVVLGEYIARRLPDRAVFISMWHSGSIRYYSGRLTVRYDWIPPTALDSAIADLRRLNYHPYIVLEQWEEVGFREKFREHSHLAALDWPPVALVDQSLIKVRVYDPADQETRDRRAPTEFIR